MAVAAANLTQGGSAVAGSSYSTASITPGSNRLVLVEVSTRTNASVTPNTPTLSGNGLTWVQIGSSVDWDTGGTSRKRTSLFRSMGASPSTGALTFDFAGQSQTHCAWTVDECTGMDTSGTNGSGAIVQSASNQDTTGTATSLTVTLAAFSDADNATYGAFTEGNNVQLTPGSGFSGVGFGTSGVISVTSIFKATNDTTVDASEAVASELGGIAVEIKVAAVAASTPLRMLMGMGT